MFRVHTRSGSVYTVDDQNMKVLRESEIPFEMSWFGVPLHAVADYMTGNWQDILSWEISERLGRDSLFDSLYIRYTDGSVSWSTEVLRVENLTEAGA